MRTLPLIVSASLWLAGCQAPAAAPEPQAPALATSAPETPPRAPDRASPPVAPTPDVMGLATARSGPFAGAEVTAVLLGDKAVLARTTTAADGRFGLVLPATVPSGALVRVVATKEGRSLVGLVTAPAGRRALAHHEAVLTDATTLAVLLLNPRFEAAGQATRNPRGVVFAEAVNAALEVYSQLATACEQALGSRSDEALEQVREAVKPTGDGVLPPGLGTVMAGAPGLRSAFDQSASSLGQAIRSAFQQGGQLPPAELLAPVALGDRAASSVWVHAGSSGSTGSSGESTQAPSAGAEGVLVVEDGQVRHSGTESSQLAD